MTFLNGVHKRRLIAKETSIANCEVLDAGKALHRCSGGTSVKVTSQVQRELLNILFLFPNDRTLDKLKIKTARRAFQWHLQVRMILIMFLATIRYKCILVFLNMCNSELIWHNVS